MLEEALLLIFGAVAGKKCGGRYKPTSDEFD